LGGRWAQAAAYLPAAVALVIILLAGLFAERQSRALADLSERAAVRGRVELLAAGLQRAIERSNFRVTRGQRRNGERVSHSCQRLAKLTQSQSGNGRPL
jgi:hypothetical protein